MSPKRTVPRLPIALLATAIPALVLIVALIRVTRGGSGLATTASTPTPALTVELVSVASTVLPVAVAASGNVAAWREAIVGAESDGLRLTDVRVEVGDAVRAGQLLATFDAALLEADVAEARAAVAVAQAEVADADANAARARALRGTGALSAQQVDQLIAAAATARARLDAARAAGQRHRLRLAATRVLAPADGIVSSRTATVGAVVASGEELFRLIEDGRLEWRASVAVDRLDAIAPGQAVELRAAGRPAVRGTVRSLSPVIDTQTDTGLLYVDLPPDSALRAGAFATGHIEVGATAALTIPQSALLLRDGFHQVLLVDAESKAVARRVAIGRRVGDLVEVTAGLAATEAVIAQGAGFLGEGDAVRIVGGGAR